MMNSQGLRLVVMMSWLLALRGIRSDEETPPPCVQKLVPCEPYIKGDAPPPPTCCVPLKGLLKGDYRCLCAVIDNEALLRSLNVTREDALRLPSKCGAHADLHKCNIASAPLPPPSPVSSTPPPPPPEESPRSAAAPHMKMFTSLGAAIMVLWAWTFMASPFIQAVRVSE